MNVFEFCQMFDPVLTTIKSCKRLTGTCDYMLNVCVCVLCVAHLIEWTIVWLTLLWVSFKMQFVVVITLVRCVVVSSFHINVFEFNFDVSRTFCWDLVIMRWVKSWLTVLLLCVCLSWYRTLCVDVHVSCCGFEFCVVLCVFVLVSFSLSWCSCVLLFVL